MAECIVKIVMYRGLTPSSGIDWTEICSIPFLHIPYGFFQILGKYLRGSQQDIKA